MELSLIRAAELSGKSKSTIHRAIKTGKLSAKRNDDGSWSIDPSELSRVFPEHVPEPPNDTGRNPKRNAVELLEMRVESLEAELRREKEIADDRLSREQETVDDLRKRLDRAEDRVSALIAAPALDKSKGGFWSKLLGKS